jgi:DNA-binding NtrC family response regulator
MTTTARARGARLLIVDDDAAIRLVVQDRFQALGYQVETARDGDEALAAIDAFEPAVVLLDLRMPGRDGFAVLESLRERPDRPAVIVITAHGSIEAAVKAVRMGASDFIAKPFELSHVQHVVEKALETEGLRRRVARLETELSGRHCLVPGDSAAMRQVVSIAERAAGSSSTVLLLGESGAGKEVIARYVHARSARADGPFVALNCAALSRELLQSELFGHEKGAFTGAVASKPGRLEQADGGTLFLDEIGELDPEVQAKLLRVLQEREFERVGGTRTLSSDVRIVCATHRDLPRAIAEGRFREDLYYRINIIAIRVPPLRERPEDVGALIDYFVARHGQSEGAPGLRLSDDARALLSSYPWPGNVRELSNVIERMVVLRGDDVLGVEDLPEEVRDRTPPTAPAATAAPDADLPIASYHDAVREAKRAILRQALERADHVQTRAAKLLGLTQPYMARLMKNLDVKRR